MKGWTKNLISKTKKEKQGSPKANYTITRLIVDGDTVVYTAAFAIEAKIKEAEETQSDGGKIVEYHAPMFIKFLMESILEKLSKHLKQDAKLIPITYFLTSNDKSNFRFKVAKTKEYKGNRKEKEKPRCYDELREYLIKKHRAKVVTGIEADDAISIEMRKDPRHTLAIGRDKDFRQIPGWHFWYQTNEKHPKKPYYVELPGYISLERSASGTLEVFATGDYQIAYQMLEGDTSDNIPGIEKGWGPMKCYDALNCNNVGWKGCPIEHARYVYTLNGKSHDTEVYQLVKLLEKYPND